MQYTGSDTTKGVGILKLFMIWNAIFCDFMSNIYLTQKKLQYTRLQILDTRPAISSTSVLLFATKKCQETKSKKFHGLQTNELILF